MSKFLQLCKKPFLIASIVLFFASTIFLIVLYCIPHASKYTYKDSILGQNIQVDMIFQNDDKLVINMYVTGEENITNTLTANYYISNGKLYTREDNGSSMKEVGPINNFEAVFKMDAYGMTKITLVSETSVALRTTTIVLMCFFALVFAGCLTIFVLCKKGYFDSKEKTDDKALESSSSQ